MQCTHTLSEEFRTSLPEAISRYGEKWHAPKSFVELFNQSIVTWLNGDDPTGSHPLIGPAQQKIGWSLLLRGFLTLEWRYFLEATSWNPPDDMTSSSEESSSPLLSISSDDDVSTPELLSAFDWYLPDEPAGTNPPSLNIDRFLSGLIKTVWRQLSEFWERHLKATHGEGTIRSSPATADELRIRIRVLHQSRNEVLHQHRDRYFHQDLSSYLKTATQHQMQSYLDNYESLIFKSIRRAQHRQSQIPSLLTFPGFTRTVPPPVNSSIRLSPLVTEEPPHHKHSRWRPTTQAVIAFRSFFS